MLTVCTWKWGVDKYTTEDVAKLAAGCRRHITQPFRFLMFTDNVRDFPEGVEPWAIRNPELTKVPGCFARLRMFDPQWMPWHDIDRLVCMDLDVVVTGPLDPLFDRPEKFVILHGANAVNPCPYNGSLMLVRVGACPEAWTEFSMDAARKAPYHEFPDDQGWLWHKCPNAAGWKAGPESGVYAFKKPGWPKDSDDLPSDARLVVFPGWRSPEKFKHLPWVREHWRC
jgi:hypothetical protein